MLGFVRTRYTFVPSARIHACEVLSPQADTLSLTNVRILIELKAGYGSPLHFSRVFLVSRR